MKKMILKNGSKTEEIVYDPNKKEDQLKVKLLMMYSRYDNITFVNEPSKRVRLAT